MNQLLSFIGFFLYLCVVPFIAPLLALLYAVLGLSLFTRSLFQGLRAFRIRPSRRSRPQYAFPEKRGLLQGVLLRAHLVKNLSSNP
ncbi:hypothetical protein V9K67_04365 [Paraflavisolibacter sp. H34]|uniref:hypothetical protein n=1 Tax=Huijunlia imazamoxiresistens TaxID=3127457 RepID=UPI00301ACF6A